MQGTPSEYDDELPRGHSSIVDSPMLQFYIFYLVPPGVDSLASRLGLDPARLLVIDDAVANASGRPTEFPVLTGCVGGGPVSLTPNYAREWIDDCYWNGLLRPTTLEAAAVMWPQVHAALPAYEREVKQWVEGRQRQIPGTLTEPRRRKQALGR